MKVLWTEHKTNEEMLQMLETERNNGHHQKQTEEMARSHPETRLITENNVRKINTGKQGSWETKNNVLGLATDDGGRQYQLQRTKDVCPGQV